MANARRNQKKRATRGAAHPDGRGSRRWSERPTNPLDEPSPKYGKNPRDLSAAVRRSTESTGMSSTGARGIARKSARISKHDSTKQREKQEDASTRVRGTHQAAAAGRKGGPGKRRPYPKKSGGGR